MNVLIGISIEIRCRKITILIFCPNRLALVHLSNLSWSVKSIQTYTASGKVNRIAASWSILMTAVILYQWLLNTCLFNPKFRPNLFLWPGSVWSLKAKTLMGSTSALLLWPETTVLTARSAFTCTSFCFPLLSYISTRTKMDGGLSVQFTLRRSHPSSCYSSAQKPRLGGFFLPLIARHWNSLDSAVAGSQALATSVSINAC